jgi:hypothetical protein
MIAFDTENKNDFLLLCTFYNDSKQIVFDYKDYKNQEELRTAIIKFIHETSEKIFVSHNLEYDLCNIFLYPDRMFFLDLYYKGRLLFAKLLNTKKKFIDSFNFSFSSLKNVGENIGIQKIETDDFYNIDYCMNDSKIVFEYMKQFSISTAERYSLKIKNTLAGTAQNIFLKKYDCFKLGGQNVIDEILNCYYGGRTELFLKGKIDFPVYVVDINSSYPASMLQNMPVTNCYETVKPETRMYLSEIEIELDYMDIPVLPFRDDRLLFPVGKFITWACSPEIEFLKDNFPEKIKSITYKRTFNFPVIDYPFYNFVNTYYTERQHAKNTGDKFNANFLKLILNSTYGRFAVNGAIDILNGDERRQLNIESQNVINFALPVFITSYARVALYNMFMKVKKIGGHLIYCDTDSVMFSFFDNKDHTKKIKSEFTINNEIGKYSLETYSGGEFYNLKAYTLGNNEKVSCKGISGKDNKIEYLTTGKTKQVKPVKYRQGQKSIKGLQTNFWTEFEKQDHFTFNKRILIPEFIHGLQLTRTIIK